MFFVYTYNIFMKIKYSETFNKWLIKLKDNNAKTRIITRLRRIKTTNNFGDYKSLGDNFLIGTMIKYKRK